MEAADSHQKCPYSWKQTRECFWFLHRNCTFI